MSGNQDSQTNNPSTQKSATGTSSQDIKPFTTQTTGGTPESLKTVNRITKITKLDILNLFREGIAINDPFLGEYFITYPYFGRINEIDFLKRLYDLEVIKSNERKFKNVEDDIKQHTVNNDVYSENWFFDNECFKLINDDDKTFLNFLCSVFHPEIRDESQDWEVFLDKINDLIKKDGYQLFVSNTISSRNVYSWKRYSPEDDIFIPFSERNKGLINNKTVQLKIPRQVRYQICQAINSHNDRVSEFDDTGWRTDTDIKEVSFHELQKFYIPKAYDSNKKYTEVNNIEEFIQNTSPYNVLDAIESFYANLCSPSSCKFAEAINQIFKRHKIRLGLADGKIVSFNQITIPNIQTEEPGLEELLFEADKFCREGKIFNALEKAWDALERLKTFYYPPLNKRQSLEKIVAEISGSDKDREDFFNNEFRELTKIGNEYRIRHHEKDKKELYDDSFSDYVYRKCLSLISTSLRKISPHR